MALFKAFINSPIGPKTTHFWGPVSNLGFFIAVLFLYLLLIATLIKLVGLH
ncbi:putative mitochondrial pyruvate carrier [Helianthus annuus]|nr:putative mitochondrial pyruvate carrier [Helianthus annuus]